MLSLVDTYKTKRAAEIAAAVAGAPAAPTTVKFDDEGLDTIRDLDLKAVAIVPHTDANRGLAPGSHLTDLQVDEDLVGYAKRVTEDAAAQFAAKYLTPTDAFVSEENAADFTEDNTNAADAAPSFGTPSRGLAVGSPDPFREVMVKNKR